MRSRPSGLRTSFAGSAHHPFLPRRAPRETLIPNVQSDEPVPRGVLASIARFSSLHPFALVTALWLGVIVAVDPRGEFPLNDDWAYALPVAHLVETGELRLTFWQSMPLFSQFLWGALFCLPAGFSFVALRCSTLTLGLFGLWALYLMLRDGGVSPRFRVLAVLVMLVNPIYAALSFSFMTDVPFVALFTLSAWQLIRALEHPDKTSLLLGFGLATIATLVRQIGVVLPLAFALASLPCWGLTSTWLRRALIPLLIVGATLPLSRQLLELTIGIPGLYEVRDQSLKQALFDLAHGHFGVVRMALERTYALALYLALFLLPLTAALFMADRSRTRLRVGLFACGTITVLGISFGRDLVVPDPSFGNVLTTRGVGPALLLDEPSALPTAAWIVTRLASLGVGALAAVVISRPYHVSAPAFLRGLSPRRCFLIAAAVLGFAPFALSYGPFFDRHMLFLLPLGIALVLDLNWPAPSHFVTVFALVFVSLGALYTTFSVHDYLAWNRARWRVAARVPNAARTLDGGIEFNNYLAQRASMSTGRAGPTALLDRSDAPYALRGRLATHEDVIARVKVARWLPTTPREIMVIDRRDE